MSRPVIFVKGNANSETGQDNGALRLSVTYPARIVPTTLLGVEMWKGKKKNSYRWDVSRAALGDP